VSGSANNECGIEAAGDGAPRACSPSVPGALTGTGTPAAPAPDGRGVTGAGGRAAEGGGGAEGTAFDELGGRLFIGRLPL
jgi:hypothetical protein